MIGVIKNTVSKSVTGPNQVKMDEEELQTWLSLVFLVEPGFSEDQ